MENTHPSTMRKVRAGKSQEAYRLPAWRLHKETWPWRVFIGKISENLVTGTRHNCRFKGIYFNAVNRMLVRLLGEEIERAELPRMTLRMQLQNRTPTCWKWTISQKPTGNRTILWWIKNQTHYCWGLNITSTLKSICWSPDPRTSACDHIWRWRLRGD